MHCPRSCPLISESHLYTYIRSAFALDFAGLRPHHRLRLRRHAMDPWMARGTLKAKLNPFSLCASKRIKPRSSPSIRSFVLMLRRASPRGGGGGALVGDWVSPLAPHVSEPCNPFPSSSFPVQKESGFFFLNPCAVPLPFGQSAREVEELMYTLHCHKLMLRLTHNARRRAWYGGTYSAKGAADSVAPHDRWASR